MLLNKNRFNGYFSPHPLTRYYLVFALAVIATMAVISGYNKHPDEHHHFLATQYYTNHWLPPKVGDPAARQTYSIWGASYLDSWGIEYLLAGKLASILLPLTGDQLLAVRFFNVLLFLSLLVVYFYRSQAQHEQLIPLIFLLATPQAWYIFSYINNDALPLVLSLLIISEITYPSSPLNQFLTTPSLRAKLNGGILFGFLLGILSISKQNYYVFLLFIGSWCLYTTITFNLITPSKGITSFIPTIEFNNHLIRKYALILFIALSVFTARYALDIVIDGQFSLPFPLFRNNDAQLLAYQEQVAAPQFKPSTIKNNLAESYYSIYLKDKGLSYFELFSKWHWHESSFNSFVGNYGYLSIPASKGYYSIMRLAYIAFFLFLIMSIFISHNRSHLFFMLIVLLSVLLTIFISTYHSWTNAFQAQGRYLFPIIGMIGLFLYQNNKYLHNWITNAFISCLFLLSSYSFLFVALYRINR